METASRKCQGIAPLKSPPGRGEAEIYKRMRAEMDESLADLRKANPEAEKSSLELFGQPFNKTVERALKVSAANDALLAKFPVDDVNEDARKKMDVAIYNADLAVKWLADPKKYDASLSDVMDTYREYLSAKKAAMELDPRAVAERQTKVDELEATFVKPCAALEGKVKQQEEIKAAVEQYEHSARMNQTTSTFDSESKRRIKVAKGRGFEGSVPSIQGLVLGLGDGRMTLDAAKKKLVFVEKDCFKVLNTSDDFIFYATERQGGEPPVCVAVAREEGEFYGDNAPLRADVLSVLGAGRFTTAMGTDKDVVTFKVEPKLTRVEREALAGVTAAATPTPAPIPSGACGIGATVRKEPALPILVTGLVADGPADAAGLRPLDRVTKIDGKDVTAATADEAVAMLRGDKDSVVKLTVLHTESTEPVEISIKRAPLLTDSQRP